MTILEFLRTAKPRDIAFFFMKLTAYCECGVGECPYSQVGCIHDDGISFACLDERELEKWLNSECSEWLLEQMKIDRTGYFGKDGWDAKIESVKAQLHNWDTPDITDEIPDDFPF